MKNRLRFSVSLALFLTAFGLAALLRAPSAAAASKTGVGLSEHVLNAYSEGWKYRAGCYGQLVNGVRSSDCSGLIKSYLWWTGSKTNPNPALSSVAGSSGAMLSSAKEKGSVSNASSLPNIHGLILYSPGHVGVYVGNNKEVDNRGTGYNVKYQTVVGGNYRWQTWFKLPQISYPQTGFVTLQGKKYYYEGGRYVTGTSRTVDGVSYTFNSSGELTSGSLTDSADAYGDAVQAATKTDSAPAAQPAAYTTLKHNSSGAPVQRLQQRLSELGYYHESVNTYYDAFVSDAVKGFQKASGLEATGTADEKTQAALYASSAKQSSGGSMEPGLHSSLVFTMQKRLIALGYMSGSATTYYGDATKAAVAAFQQANGLSPTGSMDAKSLELLYSDSALRARQTAKAAPADTISSVSVKPVGADAANDAGLVHAAEIGSSANREAGALPLSGGVAWAVLGTVFLACVMMFFRKSLLPKAALCAASVPGKLSSFARASGMLLKKMTRK